MEIDYASKYGPLLRLLRSSHQDLEFLRRQKGFSSEMKKEYNALRRVAIRGYLQALSHDWKDLYQELLPAALASKELAEMVANTDNLLSKTIRKVQRRLMMEWLFSMTDQQEYATEILAAMNQISLIARHAELSQGSA